MEVEIGIWIEMEIETKSDGLSWRDTSCIVKNGDLKTEK